MRDEPHEPAGARRSRRRLRLPRRTIRLRLALLYGGVFFVSGAILLALVYGAVANTHRAYSQTLPAPLIHLHSSKAVPPPLPPGIGSAKVSVVDSDQRVADLQVLAIVSAIALAVMAAVSMGLGWLIAGRVLRPLRTITSAARDISATNLHQRLALGGPDDEFKELGDTFDGLLGRLEQSFQSQRQFVANASHELRTPLARLKTLAQVALSDPDASVESLRAAHERVLAAEQQLEGLIAALLNLAGSERNLEHREPVELMAVTEAAIAARRQEIEHRDLRLTATLYGARVEGNRQLIAQLVANLLDNAIEHNAIGGRVEVRTTTTKGQAILSVINDGPVIRAEELDRLQQPFQRLEAARTSHGDGHGLGLSIVHAIATAHGATVLARAQPDGGLEMEVRFPHTDPRPHGRHDM
ncbi:MAG TPA: ATP-binding protein [Solirubrobacteraceae bacterium]